MQEIDNGNRALPGSRYVEFRKEDIEQSIAARFERHLGDGLAHGEESMIAEEKRMFVAEVRDKTRLFAVMQRRALEIVIGQARERDDRMLRDREQARALSRHRDAARRVRMHYADTLRVACQP